LPTAGIGNREWGIGIREQGVGNRGAYGIMYTQYINVET